MTFKEVTYCNRPVICVFQISCEEGGNLILVNILLASNMQVLQEPLGESQVQSNCTRHILKYYQARPLGCNRS